MFSELIRRNSKRNRQENTLYFVTMILTVAAFYIILALDHRNKIQRVFLPVSFTVSSDQFREHNCFLLPTAPSRTKCAHKIPGLSPPRLASVIHEILFHPE